MISLTITRKIKVLALSLAAVGACQLTLPIIASAQAVDAPESDATTQTTTSVQPMSFDLGGADLATSSEFAAPAPAAAFQAASQGDQQHTTVQRQQAANMTNQQRNQPNLPVTCFGNIAGGGLPMTQFTGFVGPAGGQAEMIYGDEGTDGPPPYFGYTEANSIQAGL
jgi:hypothetical protein